MKLPKQWKRWCKIAGLKPIKYRRDKWSYYYLKGHERYWRINRHDMFQCGDTYHEFDRWANSEIRECPIPQSQQQFVDAVQDLLYQYIGV